LPIGLLADVTSGASRSKAPCFPFDVEIRVNRHFSVAWWSISWLAFWGLSAPWLGESIDGGRERVSAAGGRNKSAGGGEIFWHGRKMCSWRREVA
jgi:hypothetical protein